MNILGDKVRGAARQTAATGFGLLYHSGLYRPRRKPINFVVERADWVIRRLGESICDRINAQHPHAAAVTTVPAALFDTVVHFGSQFMWLTWGPRLASSNRFVVSFFHGKREDGSDMSRHVDAFLDSVPRLDRIVTAASVVERRLISYGVPREKLVRIPIGVDTATFTPPTEDARRRARARFGIPEDRICIGSFQKDGVGWGEGNEPKYIKGPDIFVESIARLAKEVPVFVLLTGPARGYVRAGLERVGVSYHHVHASVYRELVDCFHALDLYLVTSREEGGPMALMESMATGVPVVSTRAIGSPVSQKRCRSSFC